MQGEDSFEIVDGEFSDDFEGFMFFDWFQDASDVVQVLIELINRGSGYFGSHDAVDLIDVADGVSVDPDQRDHVEEGSAFMKEVSVREDSVVDGGEQFSYHVVEGNEGFVVVFAQIEEDGFEEFERVVDDFVVATFEVGDAEGDGCEDEVFEGSSLQILDVAPESGGRGAFTALAEDLFDEGFDVAKRGEVVRAGSQFVVLENDFGLMLVGLCFGEEL